MRASTLLNIVLGAALIGVGAAWYSNRNAEGGTNGLSEADIVLKNIETRATVRAFKKDPVPDKVVQQLLRAAMAAPTALNAQPWHFIVITDRGILSSLSVASPHTGMLADAPLAIAVCGNTDKALQSAERVYWLQDVCAATENLLLAAHALGLGATWTGSYPVEERYQVAKQVLALPDNIVPVSIVALGYPAVPVEPKDKWNEQNVSYQ